MPPVFAALAIGVITAGFATYHAVQGLTSKVEQTDKNPTLLAAKVEAIESNSVTRAEMLESRSWTPA